MCLAGRLLATLLNTGLPQDVKDSCKKLIDGSEGGDSIMYVEVPSINAKVDNVKIMTEIIQ